MFKGQSMSCDIVIYNKKPIFGLCLLFLAHSSSNPHNFLYKSRRGIFYYNIWFFVFGFWNRSRAIKVKGLCCYLWQAPFNQSEYLNKMTFGKSLRMGAGCQGQQPWLEGWNFQYHSLTSWYDYISMEPWAQSEAQLSMLYH